jgi:hypothetical protein
MVRHGQKRLPDRVRDIIQGRHCSIYTEQASASWTRRSMLFHDRLQPKEMGADEIEEYVTCPPGGNAACLTETNANPRWDGWVRVPSAGFEPPAFRSATSIVEAAHEPAVVHRRCVAHPIPPSLRRPHYSGEASIVPSSTKLTHPAVA